ncbi:MAG: radical SAM protein, partial [Candidatus Cloacimonetes bacterium]|nr:radical SAM protein [Candidatus Cloacimonadota bacterium]
DSGISGLDKDLLSQIKDQLILCSSSAEQLSLTLNTHINEIMKYLRELDHEGMVEAERGEKGVVYTWKS